MVKNNGIPFEVKKPFETVYELKNEIPSFEEFMKTYESDGSLNYDDLNSWNVGTVKGYGPTCPDCRWDDPDCSHYLNDGEGGYIPLYLSCPARGCGGDGNQYQWKHYNCGDNMYISAEAYIKCRKCNVPRHWKQWLFKCYLHKGEDIWREADWGEFNNALGMVSKLWEHKNAMTRLWINKIALKVANDK